MKIDCSFLTKIRTLLCICKYSKKFLLLKISEGRKICPGDWDFVDQIGPKDINVKNVALMVLKYTGLKSSTVYKKRNFIFRDFESQTDWEMHPYIIEVANKNIKLHKKYSEYKWLNIKDILKHDRENYLRMVLKNTGLLPNDLEIRREWFEKYFGLAYVWADNNDGYQTQRKRLKQRTEEEINGIINLCKLKENSKVLDLCCGYGRHIIGLASYDIKTTGIDINNFNIQVAKYRATKGLDVYENKTLDQGKTKRVRLIKGDIRKEINKLAGKFDCITNMFFSFGYFYGKDNNKIIEEVYKHLKKGGIFLMHLVVCRELLRHTKYLSKNSRKVYRTKILGRNYPEAKLSNLKYFNPKNNIFKSTWQVNIDGCFIPEKSVESRVKIYTIKELKKVFDKVGFSRVCLYGDWKKNKFDDNSEDLIVLAEK